MGLAKNRGNREERIKQAQQERQAYLEQLGLEKKTIEQLREQLGLPEDAHFRGYTVHIPDSDEFLFEYSITEIAEARKWGPLPGGAEIFHDILEAYEICREEKGEVVVGIF